ncbi:MAG: STAS domain-containing protein [Alphaproteobacteria bacterium]|nr:STAS domain-containing protein [Alphaproteobacteria bacterium]
MDYQKHTTSNGIKFELSGTFTFADHQIFKTILEHVDEAGIHQIELDMAAVTFIDSAALGMLLLLRDRCQSTHTPIIISRAQGQTEKVMRISKFDQLFTLRS